MQRLHGKVALVTGAGAGIGEAICHRFTAEGATVVALDRSAEALARMAAGVAAGAGAGGGALHTITADISREADCRRAVEEARARHGALHALCNVAGIVEMGTLVDASEESWQRSHDVNVKGTWYLCRLAVPILAASGGGSIVNIASVAGLFAVRERGVYSTTKAGVVGLSKSLAMDFIGQGIRVNAICPGTVETPSLHDRINQAPDPQQALADFIARQPMGRLGRPDEIAALAAYLVSDESAYMTGQALVIDGGMTM
jgi:2-keto-3-deoxy-L-fuconate dehydrogenase